SARVVWLPDGDTLRLGWSVVQATDAGGYQVWVDAVSGEVADARSLRIEEHAGPTAVAAPARVAQEAGGCELDDDDAPAACVFPTNAFFASGGEADPDPDDTDDLLVEVPLLGLDDPESGRLVGEFVDVEPNAAPIEPVVEDDGLWSQGRGEDGFEAAMAYFWVDRTQRLFQELGIDDARNESFPVVPIDPDVENNAFYDGADQIIHLGVGPDDGINEGEDADGIIHEYGHAVLDQQVPGLLLRNGDGGAYHEAFGDILTFLTTLEFRPTDAACLFHWTDQVCLRRMDGDSVYPDDLVGQVHTDGGIMTGAVFDITTALLDEAGLTLDDCVGTEDCDEVRNQVLTAVLEGHRFLAGNESLPEIAAAIEQANEVGFDGEGAEAFAAGFAEHGLDTGSGNTFDPDGASDGEVPAVAVAADISHSFRGDLRIELRVVDADFEPLCDPITLLEPDGSDGDDDVELAIDVSDSLCARFAPPSEDAQWELFVLDTADADTGQVDSFQVFVEGEPFLATGVPAPIADNDPSGTAVIVNASGSDVDQEGTQPVEEGAEPGAPFASVEISHTFVGDLFLRAGVADATGTVLCTVPVLEPDPTDDSSEGVSGNIDMADCAEFFPPSAERRWFVEVVDYAAVDEGTIDAFSVSASPGVVVADADDALPVTIPDADPDGVVVLIP
ncbi:MAG: hypothetical protein M3527_10240, partial [Actinomycetota bacterium]|nr:hypothetical protein [Actinomycetota bacterium]